MKNKSMTLVLWASVAYAQVHESGTYNRVEDIGSDTFACKVFFDDAQVLKEFAVNGQSVDQQAYEQHKIQACTREYHEFFDTLKTRQLAFEQSCARVEADTALALIKKLQTDMRAIINKLHAQALEKFSVFSADTIESAVFLKRVEQHLIPALDFCDDPAADQEDAAVLKRMARVLMQVHERLQLFYQATVKAALEQADNPKVLQKLLEMV